MKPEEYIQHSTGISKRLFMAISDLRGNPSQLEDALFQLSSVIDSTSKEHYPNHNSSKKRFVQYLTDNETDIFWIASYGKFTIKDSYFKTADGSNKSFGEILYSIRCSSYHDPEELDTQIQFGPDNEFGHTHDGKFKLSRAIILGLIIVLITDEKNKDRIDKVLFNEIHFLTIKEKNYPYTEFLGDRQKLMDLMK